MHCIGDFNEGWVMDGTDGPVAVIVGKCRAAMGDGDNLTA